MRASWSASVIGRHTWTPAGSAYTRDVSPSRLRRRSLPVFCGDGRRSGARSARPSATSFATARRTADRRWDLRAARFRAVETVQAYYSIAGRDLEREVVPMMTEERLGLMVWSPLAGGLMSGKFGPDAPGDGEGEGRRASFDFPPVDRERAWACVAVMREIAERHKVSVAAVAFAYVLAKPFVTTVIIGVKRLEQLEQNLAAVGLQLDDDELGWLDAVSALPGEYPGWMLPFQAQGRRPADFAAGG